MKLGATYSVFSGEELLKGSILSIRENVEYINVVYQRLSWTGNEADSELIPLLDGLKTEGLIDSVIEYVVPEKHPNTYKWAQRENCRKRNMGLKDLKKNHCTHCLFMDADEFYKADEFARAKSFIEKNRISHSCCNLYDYKVSPRYRKQMAADYAVPFILKLNALSFVSGYSNLPCRTDHLRVYPMLPFAHKFYYLNMISMHHMTGIRRQISSKLNNTITNYMPGGDTILSQYRSDFSAISGIEEGNTNELLNNGYIQVDDYFNVGKWLVE